MAARNVKFSHDRLLFRNYIQEKDNDIIFHFKNKESCVAANKSKNFIVEFYDFLNKRFELQNIKIRNEKFSFARFLSEDTLHYINKMPASDKKQILSSLSSLSENYSGIKLRNKVSLFFVNFERLGNQYVKEGIYTPPANTLKTLHKSTLLRETYFPESGFDSSVCPETYIGFIRAIRADTLTTAKVMIDGKETRVFIKSGAGTSINYGNLKKVKGLKKHLYNINLGHNTLALEPKTLKLYQVKTEGKTHIAREITDSKLYTPEQRELRRMLKKELTQHLNVVYAKRDKKGNIIVPGIRRMKETHERMKTPKNKAVTKEATVKKLKLIKNKKLRPKLRIRPR